MHKSLLILFLSVAVLACTNMEEASPFRVEQSSFISTKVSNDYSFNRDDLDNDYFIKDEDINDYIKFKSLNDDKEIHVKEINPFDFQGAILFYVINYEDGWEIISADKRTPFLLAEGETGSFTMKDYDATPWGTWMFSIGLDVLNTRLNGIDASFEENENLKFWTLITKPEIILGAPSDSIVPSELVPDGHYELISTYTMTDYDYITINHLTSTKWSQSNNNCNYYVPYRTDYSSLKAPAGCVAISGAQMLYYLHNEIGVPSAAPNSAYCYGNVNSYQMGQSGSSTTIWSQMTTYGDIYTAILIANAGSCVGMDYGNEGSGANTSDLVDNFFGFYGIDCSYGNYDTNAIRSQIINRRMPIIVRAESLELFDTWYGSHSFIIDGVKYTRNKTIYYYEWVYDVEPGAGSILPEPPHPYTVETYSFNSVEFIKMNWGWGDSHNDESFSPGGDWFINDNGQYNFQYNRKMISGFCAN